MFIHGFCSCDTLVSGIGLCFIYVPGYLIVGEYFDDKKGVAMALSTVGSGVGAFLFPFLIQVCWHDINVLFPPAVKNQINWKVCRPRPKLFFHSKIMDRQAHALRCSTTFTEQWCRLCHLIIMIRHYRTKFIFYQLL